MNYPIYLDYIPNNTLHHRGDSKQCFHSWNSLGNAAIKSHHTAGMTEWPWKSQGTDGQFDWANSPGKSFFTSGCHESINLSWKVFMIFFPQRGMFILISCKTRAQGSFGYLGSMERKGARDHLFECGFWRKDCLKELKNSISARTTKWLHYIVGPIMKLG